MNCPNCGTLNADTSKFCHKCGNKLPQALKPQDPVSQAATIGGIAGIAGGGLTILGWLLPWFGLGGLLGGLLNLLNLGGGFGLNFGSGIGNGLQLTFFSLIGGFAALGNSDKSIIGILALINAGILIGIPVLGGMNVRSGIRLFEEKSSTDVNQKGLILGQFSDIRSRSTAVFVIMAILFIILSLIPFGTSVLASGFYLTAIGAVGSFFGVLYSRSQI